MNNKIIASKSKSYSSFQHEIIESVLPLCIALYALYSEDKSFSLSDLFSSIMFIITGTLIGLGTAKHILQQNPEKK
jgi:hypothetical protein